ncbi:MAG: hypothetical protein ACYC5O_12000 [Anaerolineae bacterium]
MTPEDTAMDAAIANIIDFHLRPRAGQEVAVLYDDEKAPLAEGIAAGLAARGCAPWLVRVPDDVDDVGPIVAPLFARADVGLVALISRRMWLDLGFARYFAMVDGQPSLLAKCHPIFADWLLPLDGVLRLCGSNAAADAAYLRALAAALPARAPIHLTAPGGTDLRFVSRTWHISEWTEVLTAPVEDSVCGRIVADTSVFFARVAAPIVLTVDAGRIIAIEPTDETDATGATYVDMMQRELERDPAGCRTRHPRWQLAEVGIGGCAGARLSGIIMEDEAVRGTCHFCFGDNARYGGANACDWHGGTVVVARPRLAWEGGAWQADVGPREA